MLKIYEEKAQVKSRNCKNMCGNMYGLKDENDNVIVKANLQYKVAVYENGVFIFAEKKEDNKYYNAHIYNEGGSLIRSCEVLYPFNEDGLALESFKCADGKYYYFYFDKNGTALSDRVKDIKNLSITRGYIVDAISSLGEKAIPYIDDKDFYDSNKNGEMWNLLKNTFKEHLINYDYSTMTEKEARKSIELKYDNFKYLSDKKIERYKNDNETVKKESIKNFIEDLIK